jgi:hypothetical protein
MLPERLRDVEAMLCECSVCAGGGTADTPDAHPPECAARELVSNWPMILAGIKADLIREMGDEELTEAVGGPERLAREARQAQRVVEAALRQHHLERLHAAAAAYISETGMCSNPIEGEETYCRVDGCAYCDLARAAQDARQTAEAIPSPDLGPLQESVRALRKADCLLQDAWEGNALPTEAELLEIGAAYDALLAAHPFLDPEQKP